VNRLALDGQAGNSWHDTQALLPRESYSAFRTGATKLVSQNHWGQAIQIVWRPTEANKVASESVKLSWSFYAAGEDVNMAKDISELLKAIEALNGRLDSIKVRPAQIRRPDMEAKELDWLQTEIRQRIEAIGASVKNTASGSKEQIEQAVRHFRDWMLNGTVVRIIGAGRARLAASIPANRLAHGGARVYIQDDIIPMPHSIKGGAFVAVSASGETQSVLEVLRTIQNKGRQDITIIGIANRKAIKFRELCPIFIGIDEDTTLPNPLHALADTGEYVISELLDAMVVAAGKLAGFDDTTWRLGHEDIGATGPYDALDLAPVPARPREHD
jgi:D-arabinose 5-phosphate isomerase GutQ